MSRIPLDLVISCRMNLIKAAGRSQNFLLVASAIFICFGMAVPVTASWSHIGKGMQILSTSFISFGMAGHVTASLSHLGRGVQILSASFIGFGMADPVTASWLPSC